MSFIEISPFNLTDNLFQRIGHDWMLVTAGDAQACNTMTASWGQAGFMWNLPAATVYVRPQRYTYEFMEKYARYSLNFFAPETQRPALNLLGTKSGRDGDKITEAGLHTALLDGVPYLAEANLVLICRKLYRQDLLEECFVDKQPSDKFYPQKDYHRMYIGEIEKVYCLDE